MAAELVNNTAFLNRLTLRLSEQLGDKVQILELSPLSGGDISEAFKMATNSGDFFLKTNTAKNVTIFYAEAQALAKLQPYSPQCIATGTVGDISFIVLEFCSLSPQGDDFKLGELVATLHKKHAESTRRFGWDDDNFIGTTPQFNSWKRDWSDFWIENRILPQILLLKKNGMGREVERIQSTLIDSIRRRLNHQPVSTLLHGDLWRGNAGFSHGAPIIYDPASYYGDRETDLALTELFGGFSKTFYQGYESVWPIDKDYARRKPIYNLYHLLNHTNLFGGAYLSQTLYCIQSIINND